MAIPSTQHSAGASSAHFVLFSAEFELVRACCSYTVNPVSPETLKLIDVLLAGSIRWQDVLRILDRHRVQGLAYRALCTREEVPPAIQQRLAEGARKVARQNVFAAAYAARLCKTVEAEGIHVAVLKGLPLCMQAYGDLSIRHSKDIDLLVAPEDVDRAAEQLQAMGYVRVTPHDRLSAKQEAHWRIHKKDFSFLHPLNGSEVELHWRPFDNVHLMSNRFPLDPLQRIEISRGLSLPALSDRELLLYLCVHGAQHAWFRLKWVADIAALSARLTPHKFDDLLELGKEMGVEQTVRLALLHSTSLFGLPSEATLRPTTRLEHFLMSISNRVMLRGNGMEEPKDVPFGLTWISIFQLLLKPRPSYWFEEIYRWMISGNWDAVTEKPPLVSALRQIPHWIKRHAVLRKNLAILKTP